LGLGGRGVYGKIGWGRPEKTIAKGKKNFEGEALICEKGGAIMENNHKLK